MPIDPTKRVDNWNEKYNLERVSAILTEKRPKMLQNMSAVVPLMTAMEIQVKQVCDGEGATVIELPFYLCFGREIWKLTRQDISGEAAALEAATKVAKWVSRGLTQSVLQKIRTDVFNISAPVAP
jgi:hypothetical protein